MRNGFGPQVPASLVCLVFVFVPFEVLALSDKQNELNSYGRQTWATENGLPQNAVHAILQTRDGYIWLATEGGLARFDGTQFAIYSSQNTPELQSNDVRDLLDDYEGFLWIATADGITRLKGSEWTTFSTTNGLPDNNVWSLYRDHAGALWAITASGLAQFENGRFKPYPDAGAAGSNTGGIGEDSHGMLWIGTRSGLRLFQNGRFEPAPGPLGKLRIDVEAILSDTASLMWIGTQSGLYVWTPRSTLAHAKINELAGARINALYQDHDGAIWIGTESGAARIRNGQVARFTPKDALSGSSVLSIYEDREGSHWIGTESNGVTILRNQKFSAYLSRESGSDDLIRCVYGDRHGDVWIGTNEHGLTRYHNGAFSKITASNGLSSNVILALAEDQSGALLVGTPDGLNRVHNGSVSVLTSADGLADDFVRSILCSRDGSLWIGTRHGLSHLEHGHFTNYTEAAGLGSSLVGALLEDQNDLWIATLHGLSRFRNGKFTNYSTKDGLSSEIITALYRDGEGAIWIGTQGGGLNRFRNGRFTHFLPAVGIPSSIFGIAEDPNRSFWISSDAGIVRINKDELEKFAAGQQSTITVVPYGTSDGLRINECSGAGHPALWKETDGSIWFSMVKGVAVLRADRAKLNRLPPPVVIESVTIDDQVFDPSKVSAIQPGHSSFAFEYAGLSFVAPSKVRYRYKLEGFDRHWIDAGSRRVAYYTNLPPRNYRFRVSAGNNDGVWNEDGAVLKFRLEPHFYQTLWFYALVMAGLACLGYTAYRYRVKQVEAQFQAVLQERNRIAREIHDTLAQGFAAVSVQLEIVSRLLSSSLDSAKEHLDQARVLVRNSLAEARRSIWDLRSQSGENEDLAARLSKMATRVGDCAPGKIRLQVRGTYRPLAPKVEDELLKIAQEALTNAIRHAHANHINIELAFDVKRVRMTIADDGCGFATSANAPGPDGHFGLQGMRERAEQIEAELTVQSSPGKGTKISLEALVH
jgi:ligand-binding sensor domain-containing protein/signal transduction histidine kinase